MLREALLLIELFTRASRERVSQLAAVLWLSPPIRPDSTMMDRNKKHTVPRIIFYSRASPSRSSRRRLNYCIVFLLPLRGKQTTRS
jgi:hypothetical protein